MSTQYEVVIGLEIHAQMNTKTKMFCNCDNDSFEKTPNTNVCEVCMGFPGALPAINEEAINKGINAGLALGCDIPAMSKFDRKHYFYPDSPKGFQITQYDQPIAVEGSIVITLADGTTKKIGIERLHLEDDAGKLIHSGVGTLVDFNRAGTPLMEIVSKPDIRSKEEASQYARMVQQIVRNVGSSDADMEKGMMRFDLNISIMPVGSTTFGTRVEVKNLNSFRSLEKAITFEIERQAEILASGGTIAKETRGWDAEKEISESQRSKEAAADYRYFPEPDLPPVYVSAELVSKLKQSLPELPHQKKDRYVRVYEIDQEYARIISEDKALAAYFEAMVDYTNAYITVSNLFVTDLIGLLNQQGKTINESAVSPKQLASLATLINDGILSSKMGKEVLTIMVETGQDPQTIVEEKGLRQVTDSSALEQASREAIAELPKAAQDVRDGNTKAIGALVGLVMKKTKGQANPGQVNHIILNILKH